MPFLFAFLFLTLVEITVFILVGQQIGVGWTLLLVLASAAFGILLIRHQGMVTMRGALASLNRREIPLKSGFDGICLALAGLFFVIPGFVTDGVGFLLLLPQVRAGLWSLLTKRVASLVRRGGSSSRVLEGDYRRIEPDRDPNRLDKP